MNIFSWISAVSAPHDLWTIIINWIHGNALNFGWTILLFTLLVKVITSPLDFMVKFTTKKQTLVQQKYSPQISKLQKKYGADQQTLRAQTNALYKREGVNTGLGCIVTLVNMILTMVIFFTLYSSLRKVSAYEQINQYEQIETACYEQTYNKAKEFDSSIESLEAFKAWDKAYYNAKQYVEKEGVNTTTEEYAKNNQIVTEGQALYKYLNETVSAELNLTLAKTAKAKWNEVKESWLWIDNIWVADANTRPLPDYAGFVNNAKSGGYEWYVKENISERSYSNIHGLVFSSTNPENVPIRAQNGYYILAIMAGVLTFLSQWISELHTKLKNKKANQVAKGANPMNGGTLKLMKFILPAIMIMFTLTTGSGFGIYIISSSLASIVIGELTTLIVDALTKKQRLEVEEELEKEANRLIRKGKLQG
ncbi:MAG: YidC/Oxa1 family membrane protein insertase [Clostridia bacterium]|nr:YidC/Oxa1 family membrane protein insertase [Clostridia bacterium]